MGFMGNMAALAHAPAQDEILKNTFANHAFENFEIAIYESLITVADAAGSGNHVSAFRTSLKEEEAMAQRVRELITPTTQRYIALTTGGEKADR